MLELSSLLSQQQEIINRTQMELTELEKIYEEEQAKQRGGISAVAKEGDEGRERRDAAAGVRGSKSVAKSSRGGGGGGESEKRDESSNAKAMRRQLSKEGAIAGGGGSSSKGKGKGKAGPLSLGKKAPSSSSAAAAAAAAAAAGPAAKPTAPPDPYGDDITATLDRLKITYDTCAASLANTSVAKTLAHPRWIHAPKAGMSFGAVLYGYICTSALGGAAAKACSLCGPSTQSWDGRVIAAVPTHLLSYCDDHVSTRGYTQNHIPVISTAAASDDLVAYIRDPRRRLVAAFNDNKHSYGYGETHHATAAATREAFAKRTTSLRAYVDEEDIKSCQTKMMLGEYCAMTYEMDRGKMDKAIKVLHSLAFVGLADYPAASACLFHHMFGGPLRRSDFVDKDLDMLIKPGTPLTGGGKAVSYSNWRSLTPEDDPYDWELYQHARAIFVQRLKEYKLMH